MSHGHDLLIELGTEELPPTALKRLGLAFRDGITQHLAAADIAHGAVRWYASPRRLAVLIDAVADRQPDSIIEKRGPAVAVAFDAAGAPTPAALGFANAVHAEVAELSRLVTEKGTWLAHRRVAPGRALIDLLPLWITDTLKALPTPKRMRWSDHDVSFVRPVKWLTVIYGNQVPDCTVYGLPAGRVTYGHRFMSSGPIVLDAARDYPVRLRREGYVIAAFDERRAAIDAQVQALAQSVDGIADNDDDLLDEITALVEWPCAIAGRFDPEYLTIPHDALILTMKQHQKYLPLRNGHGQLLPRFITVANIDSPNPDVIRTGNERVVAPRLADARFFWEQDTQTPLAARLDSLRSVVFQDRLGSLFDKTERVTQLAVWLAERIGGDPERVRQAARLSRCDLMTGMVFEFPEMQGIMGYHLARHEGLETHLCDALAEFYRPRFAGDALPATRTGLCLSLAERADTLVGIFAIGQKPTGMKDPFGLRRAALGLLRMLRDHRLEIAPAALFALANRQLPEPCSATDVVAEVTDYVMARLRGIYLEEGFDTQLFDAVLGADAATLVDFDTRIRAVAAFSRTAEAQALAAAHKRIRNLLKKTPDTDPTPLDDKRLTDAREQALYSAWQQAMTRVTPLLATREYTAALSTLSTLRPLLDDFFEHVMVMTDDALLRRNRLTLLNGIYRSFAAIADISVLGKTTS